MVRLEILNAIVEILVGLNSRVDLIGKMNEGDLVAEENADVGAVKWEDSAVRIQVAGHATAN